METLTTAKVMVIEIAATENLTLTLPLTLTLTLRLTLTLTLSGHSLDGIGPVEDGGGCGCE
jgi:hypothetical protein